MLTCSTCGMKDIASRKDLELLLSEFYGSLLQDAQMRHIFIDVAKIDLKEHLPPIVDFWQHILFGTVDYRKNVLQLHVNLNAKTKLSPDNFHTWLRTFETAVDAHFCGENSEKIKTRAVSIATIMQLKVSPIAR